MHQANDQKACPAFAVHAGKAHALGEYDVGQKHDDGRAEL